MGALTTTLIGLTASSSLMQYHGERQAAKGAARRGAYEGALLERAADVEELRGEDALARGAQTEGIHRAGVRRLAGSQRARLAAQGIDIDTGSALDVQLETYGLGELDALTIRNNAKREAWGYRVSAGELRGRAQLARIGGPGANVGTLLTGAAATTAAIRAWRRDR